MDDDQTLVAAWRAGDRDAGGALIERYYDAMTRFFANKASHSADDLVQRTFLACAESIQSFRGDGVFRAFLFGIARNVLLEHIRRNVRDGAPSPDFENSSIVDLAPGVATMAARRAEQRILAVALQRIPLELQILLELYYWEGLSIDELAAVSGVPPGTVKSRLHRARVLLREAIEKAPGTIEEHRTAQALLRDWAAEMREQVEDGLTPGRPPGSPPAEGSPSPGGAA